MHKRIKNISTIILVSAVLFGAAFFVSKTQAGIGENVSGWLWGGSDTGVGWISMNNINQASTVSYGANIPTSDGALSGYVWSENVGWIDFAPVDPYPTIPSKSVQVVYDSSSTKIGSLSGWARIVSIQTAGINAGGWLGWIKLAGTNYGVTINSATGKFSGYAWSDELGWIDFSKASINVPKTIVGTVSVDPGLVTDSNTPVTVTATIDPAGTTAVGNNIKYELDCTGDGQIEKTYDSVTGEMSHIFSGSDACKYSSSSFATVKITRDNATASPKAQVIFGCVDSVCNIESYKCESQIKSPGNCNSGCNATNCKAPASLNWKEVSPN